MTRDTERAPAETMGQVAFEAFVAAETERGILTGSSWEGIGKSYHGAWEAAAGAVVSALSSGPEVGERQLTPAEARALLATHSADNAKLYGMLEAFESGQAKLRALSARGDGAEGGRQDG